MKVLLVDDHELIRDSLKRNIELQGGINHISEASNGKDALLLLKKETFDVIVLDLTMPDMDGLDVLRIIRKKYPANHVMIYTMHSPKLYGVQAIEEGALSYMTKNLSLRELLLAITAVAKGEKFITPELAALLADAMRKQAEGKDKPKFSSREIEVGKRMAKGMSPEEIGIDLDIGVKSVYTYYARIKNELGVTKKSEVIAHFLNNNYMV
ncbi:MAG: response regulator transcription factor [Bacteroidota bacterium]